jgi:hypothetical protein
MVKPHAIRQAPQLSDERAKEIADLVQRIGDIDGTLSCVRDMAYLYADMAHELPEEKQTVMVNAQEMRTAMTLCLARLEDAIESLGTVQAMVSLLDDKSAD